LKVIKVKQDILIVGAKPVKNKEDYNYFLLSNDFKENRTCILQFKGIKKDCQKYIDNL